MKGKIVLVTGATSGIGRATTEALAEKGATVVMMVRNETKAKELQQYLLEKYRVSSDYIIADLSSLQQVKNAAEDFNRKYSILDVLINNAGLVSGREREMSVEGYEKTMAVNHLAHFLLTALLFKQLKNSVQGRIINLASEAHRRSNLDTANINMEGIYSSTRSYGNAKLANILFTKELNRRLPKNSMITVNAVHPGVIGSNFARGSGGFYGVMFKVLRPFLKSPEKGAETTVFLASEPAVAAHSGKYWKNKRPLKPSKSAQDPDLAKSLWEVSEKLTGVRFEVS